MGTLLRRPISFGKAKHVLRSHPSRKVTSQYKCNTVYSAGPLFSRKNVTIESFCREMSHLALKRSVSGQASGYLVGNYSIPTASVNWSGLYRPAPKTLEPPVGLK